MKERCVYLSSLLQKFWNLSDLPMTIIFQFLGMGNHYGYAKKRMEFKRKKFLAWQQKYEERKRTRGYRMGKMEKLRNRTSDADDEKNSCLLVGFKETE